MFHIKRNLPTWERTLRIALGIAVGWATYSAAGANFLFMAMGVATAATLIFTAFIGFCPACWMVGRRSLDS